MELSAKQNDLSLQFKGKFIIEYPKLLPEISKFIPEDLNNYLMIVNLFNFNLKKIIKKFFLNQKIK